jgi:hypothetical protein
MFGGGHLAEASRAYAERLGICDHVEVTGSMPYSVVRRSILDSRAVVSTNDFSNLTNTVLTAMYYRIPVIVRDWGQVEALAPGVPWTSSEVGPEAAADVANVIARCLVAHHRAPPFRAGHLWAERMARELTFTLAEDGGGLQQVLSYGWNVV